MKIDYYFKKIMCFAKPLSRLQLSFTLQQELFELCARVTKFIRESKQSVL